MIRPPVALGLALLGCCPGFAQVQVELAAERSEYLLYEPLEIKVKVANLMGDALDLRRPSGKEPWLDFLVVTRQNEVIGHTEKPWTAPPMLLAGGEVRSAIINIIPYFALRDPGEYEIVALVALDGKRTTSRGIKISVVKGASVWHQEFTAPADPPTRQPRFRSYALLIHRTERGQMLYARIQNPKEERVFCTTPLGMIVNYGEPGVRIDRKGNLHVLHQSGTRTFTYNSFSTEGRSLSRRFFSNIGSPPQMVVSEDGELLVVGGEEIFFDDKNRETVIPTAPAVKIPDS